jgi:hypothetical protein
MKALEVVPNRVKFPARCVGCGASPSRDVTLESFRGWDLLYVRWGHYCEVPLPVCQRCWAQRWRRRVGWFASIIGGIVGLIAVCALLASLGDSDELGPVLMGALVIVLLPMMLYLRAREQEVFQRWFSPVWLRGWRPKENRVELCFRDEKLADEVAVLSGLAAPPAREAHYREPAVVAPPPSWKGPTQKQLPWWSALVISAMFLAVSVGEFIQYSDFERTGESFRDQALFVFLYELGGKWLLSGLLGAMGIGFFVGAFVWKRLVKRQ